MIDKAKRDSTIKRAEELFSMSFGSYKEIETHLKAIGFKLEQETMSNLDNKILFLEKLYHTPHSFLVVGNSPFMYESMVFNSLKDFLNYYRIIKPTLFKELIKNNFNVKQSILKCENDPGYRAKTRPVIGTKKYDSVLHLAETYDICSLSYMRYLREGFSFEEALDKCKEIQDKNKRFDSQLPVKVLGKSCNSLEDIAEVFNVSKSTISGYTRKYDKIEEFISDYEDVYLKNLAVETKKLIMNKYGLTPTQLSELAREHSNDLDAVIDKLEMLKFEYKGEVLYPYKQHVSKYNLIYASHMGNLRKLLLSTNEQEEKNKLAKEYIELVQSKSKSNNKLKISTIFS